MKRFVQKSQVPFSVAAVAVLASALCLTGCGAKRENAQSASSNLPAATVRVQTVESKLHSTTEEIVSTVQARRHATLEAKLSGRIETMPVVLGQSVKAGEVIARLDAGEIKARLDQAEASLEQAGQDWKRISALFEQQAVTRAEYDASQAHYGVAKGAVSEAKAMMSYVEIVAPFDGVVTKKWADVGDFATPGKPLIAIEDPSALQLEADVPEAIASHIQHDLRLTARVDGVSGELTGTVSEIAPAADPVSRTFRVKIDLLPTPGLMSGQFARLIMPFGESHSLRVPASAVVQRGQMELVFVVVNGHAQLRIVKTGNRIGDELELVSGVDAGEQVVVDGAGNLVDGQLLTIKP
jgi:RND family efflux transporter MFP subunit